MEKKKFDQWIEKAKGEQKLWIDDKALAAVQIPSQPEVSDKKLTN